MTQATMPMPARRVLTQPERAAVVLLATTTAIAAILAAWLLLWVINRKPSGVLAGHVAPSGLVAPFQDLDVSVLGKRNRLLGGSAASEKDLVQAFRDAARAGGNSALVIALFAIGIEFDGKAYLLPSDELGFVTGKAGEGSLIALDALLETLREVPQRRKLLILDASASGGSDRNLGVFGNGFVHRLASELENKPVPNLVVLCSAAPGQTSWVSELDQRSVFGHYVALGLSGQAATWDRSGVVTVQGLARYVTAHVSRWALANRQAEQVPILLGDTTQNFRLRPIGKPEPPPELGEKGQKEREDIVKLLQEGWTKRDELAKQRAYRQAPILWRRYLDGMLRAEALVRAARLTEARTLLASLGETAGRLGARAGVEPPRGWSLALGRRYHDSLTTEQRKALDAAAADVKQFINQLTGHKADAVQEAIATAAQPGTAAPKSEGPKPPEPEKPADDQQGVGALVETPARKNASVPLAKLLDRPGGVPVLVEGQLAVWAGLYENRYGPAAFEGYRARPLEILVELRGLAEEAATIDPRLARRYENVLATADGLRRKAQDALFAAGPDAVAAVDEDVRQAAELYREIRANAVTLGEAIDLLERLACDLPYLGTWVIRQEAGLDSALARFLADVTGLAVELDRELKIPAQSAGLPQATRELIARVAAAFTALEQRFHAQCDVVRAKSGPTKWRELDRLLSVPLIPAELRATLFEQLVAIEPSPRLNDDSAVSSIPPVRDGPAASAEAAEPGHPFWAESVGLAQLELVLLALGGAEPFQLEPLHTDLDAARAAAPRARPAFEALGRFNKGVRSVRAALAAHLQDASGNAGGTTDETAAVLSLQIGDRAGRILPWPFLITLPEASTPDRLYGRFLVREQLRRLGRRLIEDFAPEHALLVLEDARKAFGRLPLNEEIAAAQKVAGARLALAAVPSGTIAIDEEDEVLTLRIGATGDLPMGLAAILLRYDPSSPLAVSEVDAASRNEPGGLVPVPPSGPLERRYRLRRAVFSTDSIRFDLTPSAFYRGRTIDATTSAVVFNPAKEQVEVTLTNPTDFGDQCRDHPGRAYLHYSAPLDWRVRLTNKTRGPLKVWVQYGLDGQPTLSTTLTLAPGESNEEIQGRVIAVDPLPTAKLGPDGKPVPGAPTGPLIPPGENEVPLGTPRYLSVDVRENGPTGRPLSIPRKFEFHQQDVKEYAYAYAHFDPTENAFSVFLFHLASDRVRGPFMGAATISGTRVLTLGKREVEPIPRGKGFRFWRVFPRGPNQFPQAIPWSVDVGLKKNAFGGNEPTNVQPPAPAAGGEQPKL